LGLSIAISGGITMMTIMLIFVVVSVIVYQIQVETTASSYAFDNNDEITKTDAFRE